jgi:hypothetical protein
MNAITPPLPGLPIPRSPDPIADDEAIILSANHPDEYLILEATEACRMARRALLRLAEEAVAADIRETAANWAPNMTGPVSCLRHDCEVFAEGAPSRRWGDAQDARHAERVAREMLS